MDNIEKLNSKASILIVDDDNSMRDILRAIFQKDYNIFTASNKEDAMTIIENKKIDVVLLDICLGEDNGLEILPQIKSFRPYIEVIMITVIKEIHSAVEAIKRGAFDYINKDFDYDDICKVVSKALEHQKNTRELLYLRSEIKKHIIKKLVFGNTDIMQKVKDISQKAAAVSTTVLITGESGTGKELLARQIHDWSKQKKEPFIAVNLASIPYELIESTLFGHEKGAFTGAHSQRIGKFELADGGTLFLDEVGDLRPDLQVKLLRAIQENEIERVGSSKPILINVRLIAATNINLKQAVQNGTFREELYYRLNVLPIDLPSLKQRIDDIPKLCHLFVERYCKRFNWPLKKISPEALSLLKQYSWPGNIRELENLIERLVALTEGETITELEIPLEYRANPYQFSKEGLNMREALKAAVERFERAFILHTLHDENWRQTRAAERLGVHRKTLEYKMRRLKIHRENTKADT